MWGGTCVRQRSYQPEIIIGKVVTLPDGIGPGAGKGREQLDLFNNQDREHAGRSRRPNARAIREHPLARILDLAPGEGIKCEPTGPGDRLVWGPWDGQWDVRAGDACARRPLAARSVGVAMGG